MAYRKKIIGLAALLFVATTVPALAQPAKECTTKPSGPDSEAAHQKYIAGKVEYDEGNYDVALRRFREAYALDCTKHELLVIISAAHEKKGDRQEAIKALEDYLRLAPTSSEASTYRARIENLRKQMAVAPAPATATTTSPTAAPTTTTTAPPPAAEQQEHTAAPWIVVGVGAVGVIIGVTLILTAPALPGNCSKSSDTCQRVGPQTDADLQNDRETAGRAKGQPVVGGVVAGIGGALILGGLLWHFLEPTGPKDSGRAKLRPVVSPGFGGLSLSGSF